MKDYKIILKNFAGSYLMKRHYFLMFLLIPFLLRTIGLEQFGRLEFSKSIAYYFTIIINFGFNYSATQQILLNIDDKLTLNNIVSSTYFSKILLSIISFIALLALMMIFPIMEECRKFLFPFFCLAIASAFTPGFIYQGLNKMDWLVGIDFVCRAIFFVCVFSFIRTPEDAMLYPIFYVISDSIRTIVAMIIAYYKFGIRLSMPTFEQVKNQLHQSISMFISTISRTIYDRLPQVILGLLLGTRSVGVYVLGTRVVGEINLAVYQFMQSIFPIVAKKIKHDFSDGVSFIKNICAKVLPILGVLSTVFFVFSDKIVQIIAKNPIPESAVLLKICAFLPIIIFIYTMLGNSILVPLGFGKKNSIVVVTLSLMSTLGYIILMPYMKERGVLLSIAIAEILTLIAIVWLVLIVTKKSR